MIQVVFRKRAEADLLGIIDWYEAVAPEAVSKILSDIYSSIDQLIDYPLSGMAVPGKKFRRVVTRSYHFKIAYQVEKDRLVIIGIYRYQNRSA
jgi:plasmid stabilization system protein ParE